jgi:hypothetical protein
VLADGSIFILWAHIVGAMVLVLRQVIESFFLLYLYLLSLLLIKFLWHISYCRSEKKSKMGPGGDVSLVILDDQLAILSSKQCVSFLSGVDHNIITFKEDISCMWSTRY